MLAMRLNKAPATARLALQRQAPRPALFGSVRPAAPRLASTRCRAGDDGGKGTEDPKLREQLSSKMDTLIDELKKTGMDKAKAKEMLKKWREMGVEDPEQLRKLLLRRSLQPAGTLGLQALLDLLASAGGYYTADMISNSPPFPFQFGLQLLALFFGFYYVIQFFLSLSVLSVVLLTAYKYGTNSQMLLAAVQQMAGPATGLNVVDKAAAAVNTLKVLQTMDEIAELLKDLPTTSAKRSTLQNLSAYLTLANARSALGFEPANYGLTEREAGDIAYVFSTLDRNDDYRLDRSELRKLCQDLGKELNDDEVKEAMTMMDTSKNGYIEFNEFVAWWVKQRPAAAA